MSRRLLSLLALLCLSCLSACHGGAADEAAVVAVRVAGVAVDETRGSPVVILEELEGVRRLLIWIGVPEAQSIAAELAAETPPRPNSHDLAGRLIEGLEGRVERVVVTALRDGIYFARIDLARSSRRIEIDARPSDAIAIALRLAAPVFVHEALFEAAELQGSPAGREVRRRARERQVGPASL